MKTILGISHEELMRREAAYKKQAALNPQQAPAQNRRRKSGASRAPGAA